MQFIFACHMFMHCLFFLSFLSISSVVVAFSSSPFSFLTMEPKKSIPSKNPITRRGSPSTSYSSHSIPDRVRFYDTDSQKDFIENFCD